jgi:hypothetical protein
MALQAVMVLSDLTHWILLEICSSDGPWADTYFYVLIELSMSHNKLAIFTRYFALQIDVRPNNAMTENQL